MNSSHLAKKVPELIKKVEVYRPLGASYVIFCLIAAWCGYRNNETQKILERKLDVYRTEFPGLSAERFNIDLEYTLQKLSLLWLIVILGKRLRVENLPQISRKSQRSLGRIVVVAFWRHTHNVLGKFKHICIRDLHTSWETELRLLLFREKFIHISWHLVSWNFHVMIDALLIPSPLLRQIVIQSPLQHFHNVITNDRQKLPSVERSSSSYKQVFAMRMGCNQKVIRERRGVWLFLGIRAGWATGLWPRRSCLPRWWEQSRKSWLGKKDFWSIYRIIGIIK